jgi:hypothetical protein
VQACAADCSSGWSLPCPCCSPRVAHPPPRPRLAEGRCHQPQPGAGTARPFGCYPAGRGAGVRPTTRPPDLAFVPPAPYPPTPPSLYGDKFWYVTNGLWTWLHADGTWPMGPDSVRFDKSCWWRQGYVWQEETTPRLRASGRPLDAPRVGGDDRRCDQRLPRRHRRVHAARARPSAARCWELTGGYAGRSLRLVVWGELTATSGEARPWIRPRVSTTAAVGARGSR